MKIPTKRAMRRLAVSLAIVTALATVQTAQAATPIYYKGGTGSESNQINFLLKDYWTGNSVYSGGSLSQYPEGQHDMNFGFANGANNTAYVYSSKSGSETKKCANYMKFHTGHFIFTSGNFECGDTFYLGETANASATVTKKAGAWILDNNASVGHAGSGTLVQDGGSIWVKSSLYVGNPGTGVLTVNDGTLTVGAGTYFGIGMGTINLNGGDFAHRGMAASMRFHAEEWREVFGKSGGPVKLFVSGNHDIEGWWYMNFGTGIFPDKNVRAKYILGANTAAKWEEIWGEKYEPVWHRVVNGYHFVGQHWGEESADNPKKSYYSEMEMVKFLDEHSGEPWMASGAKPFFVVRHVAPQRGLCAALRKYPNAITLYGHAHGSAARWNMVRLYGGNAVIEMPACDSRGDKLGLAGTPPIAKVKPEGATAAGYPRSAYVLRVYDDMLVVERREFGAHGGNLGPDWMIPLGANMRDSFMLEARKAVIGNPEFPKGAKLEVSLDRINKIENRGRGLRDNNPDNPVNPVIKEPALRVTIPNANGNPQSRVFAYEAVVVGENPKVKLFKCVFAEGMNLGYGHEPNHGITTLKIPGEQLPARNKLTIAVRPVSSLGTKGKLISTTFRT